MNLPTFTSTVHRNVVSARFPYPQSIKFSLDKARLIQQ